MENLKIIEQREVLGQDFRIYGDFENPLFLANDISEVIEHTNVTKMLENIDEDEKCICPNYYLGQVRNMNFVTENGLYEVLFQSRKPIAKAFKSEVKKILKEIRLKGSYQRPMTQAEILAGQAQLLVEMERRVSEVDEKATRAENRMDKAMDVFTSPLGENWKDETNRKINTMCRDNRLSYSAFRGDLYAELEEIASCRISSRQSRLRKRMKNAGATCKECRDITKIDVIARDEKLKLIFDGIVKKYQAKYI
jgi:prophage antirepressor-like protein